MVHLMDLKMSQLRNELEVRNLSTKGKLFELQARLREAIQAEGKDVEEYEFASSSKYIPSKNVDMNIQLATIGLLSTQSKALGELVSQFEKLKAQLTAEVGSCIYALDALDQQLYRIKTQSKYRDAKQKQIVEDMQLLRNSKPAPMLKVPTFDGTGSFEIFKYQFEKVADLHEWNDESRAVALIASLKNPAAEVLQPNANYDRNDYVAVMNALAKKYVFRNNFPAELEARLQNPNETVSEFAAVIEKLAYLVWRKEPFHFIENGRLCCFKNGIRDEDIKREINSLPNLSFVETVSRAVILEQAKKQAKLEEILQFLKELQKNEETKCVKCVNCEEEVLNPKLQSGEEAANECPVMYSVNFDKGDEISR